MLHLRRARQRRLRLYRRVRPRAQRNWPDRCGTISSRLLRRRRRRPAAHRAQQLILARPRRSWVRHDPAPPLLLSSPGLHRPECSRRPHRAQSLRWRPWSLRRQQRLRPRQMTLTTLAHRRTARSRSLTTLTLALLRQRERNGSHNPDLCRRCRRISRHLRTSPQRNSSPSTSRRLTNRPDQPSLRPHLKRRRTSRGHRSITRPLYRS